MQVAVGSSRLKAICHRLVKEINSGQDILWRQALRASEGKVLRTTSQVYLGDKSPRLIITVASGFLTSSGLSCQS